MAFAAAALAFSGCSRRPPAGVALQPVSVRMDAVWPRHPILAGRPPASLPAPVAAPDASSSPARSSIAPLSLDETESGASADSAPASADAVRRRDDFEAQLLRRTARRLTGDERAHQADLAAEIAGATAAIRKQRSAVLAAIDSRWRGRLTNVKLLVLSRTQQLTGLAGGPPEEVRARLREAQQLQAAMEDAWRRERTQAASRFAQGIADAREAAQTAEDQRRSLIVAKLTAEDQRRLARFGRDGRSARPGGRTASAAPAGWPAPLAGLAATAARERPAPMPTTTTPAAQDALIRFARSDADRWVRRIARENRWRLQRAGPGVRDATVEALEKLRTVWR